MKKDLQLLMRHAAALQRAMSLRELAEVAWTAVREQTRYRNVWLGLLLPEDASNMAVVQAVGSMQDTVLEKCPRVPVAGDPMMAEVLSGNAPVVVLDATTDPRTNKDIVATLGNRTILNFPMVVDPQVIGTLGVGTFGDEGVLPPTDDELEALVVLASQVAHAYTRLQLLERQRQDGEARLSLERHLESLQRVELMGVLASGVAHDLNNFIGVVQTNLSMLDLSRLTGDDAEAVEDARHASEKAREVVQQLLALGRSQSPKHERIDLNARVASTLKLVRSSIPHAVKVTHVPGASPVVEGDPVQIDQALANLVINARDAVGSSGLITIAVDEHEFSSEFVRVHRWAKPGRFGHVRVRDTGHGIEPRLLERIYDPLFTTRSKGTGLGLAVVSRVVQQHGGLIHCDSTVGQGTTFDVYLPAH
jgi:signal transduction histidine kinase